MVLHGTFKENYSLEKRIEKLSKLPTGRVGVIIEKARNNNSKDLPDMKSSWFAVPSSIKFGHFMFRIRKRPFLPNPHISCCTLTLELGENRYKSWQRPRAGKGPLLLG